VVIVQHFPGSVKQYAEAVPFPGRSFPIPDRCPHPDCQATGCLIRWGTYARSARTGDTDYRILIQRVRCKVCGHTHSLLPDFLHPYRHYVIRLLQHGVSLYLMVDLGWGRLMDRLPAPGPARSTVREWVASFAYGAGHLLFDLLTRRLLALDPLIELPDATPRSRPPPHQAPLPTARPSLLPAGRAPLRPRQGPAPSPALCSRSVVPLPAPLAPEPGPSVASPLESCPVYDPYCACLSYQAVPSGSLIFLAASQAASPAPPNRARVAPTHIVSHYVRPGFLLY
jgi:hypothetical protein